MGSKEQLVVIVLLSSAVLCHRLRHEAHKQKSSEKHPDFINVHNYHERHSNGGGDNQWAESPESLQSNEKLAKEVKENAIEDVIAQENVTLEHSDVKEDVSSSDIGDVRDIDDNNDTAVSDGWIEPPTGAPKCKKCKFTEEAKAFRIESIKAKILKKLQLEKAPNVTGKRLPKIPHLQKIIDKYNVQGDAPYRYNHHTYDSDPEEVAKPQKIFAFAQQLPEYLRVFNSSNACFFNIESEVKGSLIRRAWFWVYLRPSKNIQNTVTYIRVFKVGPSGYRGHRPVRSMIRTEKTYRERAGGWYHFNVTKIVQGWLRDPHSNYGLEVEAFDHYNRNLIVIPPGQGADEGYEPFLEIRVTPANHLRKKRAEYLSCAEGSTEPLCCKRYLLVDFGSFEWDFILAPKRFEANLCSGECPLGFTGLYTHPHIIRNVNSSYGPCCTPVSMGSISMVYFDKNNTITKSEVTGMVVRKCACS